MRGPVCVFYVGDYICLPVCLPACVLRSNLRLLQAWCLQSHMQGALSSGSAQKTLAPLRLCCLSWCSTAFSEQRWRTEAPCMWHWPRHHAWSNLNWFYAAGSSLHCFFADGTMEKIWRGSGAVPRRAVPRPEAREQQKNSLIDDMLLPVPSTGRSPPSSVGRAQGP